MDRFFNSLKLISIVFLLASMGGCVLPRKHSALKQAGQPSSRTALLPVETPLLYVNERMSREKVIRTCNAVLDTLAKSKDGSLMGPSEVTAILGSNGVPACLWWKTEPLDIDVRSNDVAAAQLLASRLGVRQVVRCWVHPPDIASAWDFAGDKCIFELGRYWNCHISVNMQLIDTDSLRVVNAGAASGHAQHYVGFVLLPMYGGTTFGRAADYAERNALAQLFKNQPATTKTE
jgi:hypothetical protein